mgnify:CR=1 FL=1
MCTLDVPRVLRVEYIYNPWCKLRRLLNILVFLNISQHAVDQQKLLIRIEPDANVHSHQHNEHRKPPDRMNQHSIESVAETTAAARG